VRRVAPDPIRVSPEAAAKLLAGFAVDTALNRYAVRVSIRGKTITFTLTERRK
jgi:hypothetical protein